MVVQEFFSFFCYSVEDVWVVVLPLSVGEFFFCEYPCVDEVLDVFPNCGFAF